MFNALNTKQNIVSGICSAVIYRESPKNKCWHIKPSFIHERIY